MRKRPPMQPIIIDSEGRPRFQPNQIVRYLLSCQSVVNMNTIAKLPFPQSDREQFAQLIGYSVGGFAELSYVRDETVERALARGELAQKGDAARRKRKTT